MDNQYEFNSRVATAVTILERRFINFGFDVLNQFCLSFELFIHAFKFDGIHGFNPNPFQPRWSLYVLMS